MSWILDLSISLSIYRTYLYVRLVMPSYLFFCIYFIAWYITCCLKREEALEICIVIGEVLALSLRVVVYKIPYNSCMWARQDVIGVFPSYYCLSGTTCVLVIVQYEVYHYVIATVVYLVQRIIAACVVVTRYLITELVLRSIFLGWIVSADAGCAGSRRIFVERTVWYEILAPGIISAFAICNWCVPIILLSTGYNVCACLFYKSWKTSAVSTTVWIVETQLCKLRGTSDTCV